MAHSLDGFIPRPAHGAAVPTFLVLAVPRVGGFRRVIAEAVLEFKLSWLDLDHGGHPVLRWGHVHEPDANCLLSKLNHGRTPPPSRRWHGTPDGACPAPSCAPGARWTPCDEGSQPLRPCPVSSHRCPRDSPWRWHRVHARLQAESSLASRGNRGLSYGSYLP